MDREVATELPTAHSSAEYVLETHEHSAHELPASVHIHNEEDKVDDTSDEGSTRSYTPDTDDLPTPTAEREASSIFINESSTHDLSPTDTEKQPPSPQQPQQSASTPPISPLGANEAARLSLDSMTSITLSESSLDYDHLSAKQVEDVLATPRVTGTGHRRRPSSLDIVQNRWAPPERQSTFFDTTRDGMITTPMSAIDGERDVWSRQSLDFSATTPIHIEPSRESVSFSRESLDGFRAFGQPESPRRGSDGSSGSSEGPQVDWSALDKTEEQEKEDKDLPEGVEDESTAFLLARLEMENAKFTQDPKSAVNKAVARARANSSRPSVSQLKRLVSHAKTPSIRYSFATDAGLPEEPPPMTELEFWTALVQDYPSTAARLPTLTATKIRAGIPPPLRGVVWTSISGARDQDLEEAYEKLLGERSPYEGIINKDVGRSFPGVELFRDADGEGQKMLGRVLKCFSLQDKDIGYCQGLGFLVGPLLMNMGEREAFCVLVRLMDHYSLRPSFLPSLSGLHMRIFQFSTLLRQHNPKLHQHLTELGVEPAYLSQWFLSCFAVTCPLQMLFRIYDVIFAEGANETVMRIALALMRRHEDRMLGCHEFEEVMQLLLGREIWDCYGGDADVLVDDFTSLGEIVTHARLAELEKDFETKSSETVAQNAGFLPDVQAAASRFLGRLWAPGHTATASKPMLHTPKASTSTLSPESAQKDTGAMSLFARPGSFLRRQPSRTHISLGHDNSGSEDSGSSGGSYASTAPTEVDPTYMDANGLMRESMADSMSMKSKAESLVPQTPGSHNREQQELHGQIEDLLTALSEMQREHAQLAAMLQREREDRNEDQKVMKELFVKLRKDDRDDRRRTMPPPARQQRPSAQDIMKERPMSVGGRRDLDSPDQKPKDEMEILVDRIHGRLHANVRFSASLETKAQLRNMLSRTRQQLDAAEARSRDLSSRLESTECALNTFQSESEDLRSEVKELRTRVNDDFKTRQTLERQLGEMRVQAKSVERKERRAKVESMLDMPSTLKRSESDPERRARNGSVSSLPSNSSAAVGLRELQLVRRSSGSFVPTSRNLRSFTTPIQTSELSQPSGPVLSVQETSSGSASPSEAASTPCPTTPDVSTPASTTAANAPFTLPVPAATSGFSRRTTSLATKEVFATTEHEPVPEEALLLELVNAKTSEAQARQEIDELKRALTISKRRQDETQKRQEEAQKKQDQTLQQLMRDLEAAKAQAAKANEAAQGARIEADAARMFASASQMSDGSAASTPIFSLPPTPYMEDPSGSATPSPIEEKRNPSLVLPKVNAPPAAPTPATSSVGGWFWNRRTPSTSTAAVVAKEGQ